MTTLQQSAWIRRGQGRGRIVWRSIAFVGLSALGAYAHRFAWLPLAVGPVSGFGAAQALQVAGSVWFGLWGVLAGAIAPLISNQLSGARSWPSGLAVALACLIQGATACWSFRRTKADPRLRTGRDWLIWAFLGVLLSNALGALAYAQGLRLAGDLPATAWGGAFVDWFASNSLSTWLLGTFLLKFLSPLLVRTKAFCDRYL